MVHFIALRAYVIIEIIEGLAKRRLTCASIYIPYVYV